MTSSVAKTCFDAIRAKQSALAAGYDPMVVANQHVYDELLKRAVDSSSSIEEETEAQSKPNRKQRTRKQTPLVNAGYASRVLTISYAIRSFVSYQKLQSIARGTPYSTSTTDTKRRIRLVLLGCGVDIIGLWARSLLSTDDTMEITIVEIDKPEVCSIKRKMIANQGMVRNLEERRNDNSMTTNKATSTFYTGTIVPTTSSVVDENRRNCPSSNSEDDGIYDYVLIPGDLNDTTSIESAMDLVDDNGEKVLPTMVISELVLSYLPPSGTDGLLRWCANRLCRTSDCAFVCLEPLGSPSNATDVCSVGRQTPHRGVLSVEQGYQEDYCTKFCAKMERGRSQNTKTAIQPSNPLFHPIGFSTDAISSRLQKAGFASATTINLGVASSVAAACESKSKTLVCPEVFDEHAALVLHLHSYGLAYGFVAPQNGQPSDLLFRRLLCPWEARPNARPDLALARSALPRIDFAGRIVYREIEVSDEAAARSLFQTTYGKEYTDEYSAIRKLVKAALNTDMRETSISENGKGPRKETAENSSAIGKFYRSSGGIFIVATMHIRQIIPEDVIIGQTIGDQVIQSATRQQIIGCVGIRSYKGKDVDSSTTLEIFRLAVGAEHRGQGIGRNLLRSVETYAQERYSKQGQPPVKFVANTLTLLEDAAKLYERHGYKAERETPLGNTLILRTYTKEVGS